jgi:hypothetical protein
MKSKKICNPRRKRNKYGCYKKEEIKLFLDKINISRHKNKIHERLMDAFKDEKCKTFLCLSEKNPSLLPDNVFIPKSTWDKIGENAYLISQHEIDSVLSQYEGINNFHYYGIIEPGYEFAKNFGEKGEIIGIVIYFNKHWTGIVLDKNKKIIKYLDSESSNELRYKYISKIIEKINKNNFYKILEYNSIDIQQDSINCGFFVIDFIVSSINGISFRTWIDKYIKEIKKNDKTSYINYVTNLRNKYFRK